MRSARSELDVVAAFRGQLTDLPEPLRGPPGAAVAALAMVAVLAVGSLISTGAPSDALAITRDATTLELRIAGASADPEQMTRELNDAGIRGRVLVVPVAAQRAGTWVMAGEIAGERSTCIPPPGTSPVPETVRLGNIENAGAVLRIPIARVRESTGSFVLVAGRDARPGEPPVNVGSPDTVHRDILEPLLGSPPGKLPVC